MSSPIEQTQRWVERLVIGLNLCPFAAAPHRDGTIRYALSRAEDAYELLAELTEEVKELDTPGGPRTTLLIIPDLLADFADYLDVLDAAQELLERTGHSAAYQLASFHPDYRFADAPAEDPANYSNRSPHPMLHIIRRADVARAIAEHPDVEGIPARNVATLRRLGVAGIAAIVEGP